MRDKNMLFIIIIIWVIVLIGIFYEYKKLREMGYTHKEIVFPNLIMIYKYGAQYIEKKQLKRGEQKSPVNSESEIGYIFCSNCGTKNKARASFCKACGSKL